MEFIDTRGDGEFDDDMFELMALEGVGANRGMQMEDEHEPGWEYDVREVLNGHYDPDAYYDGI